MRFFLLKTFLIVVWGIGGCSAALVRIPYFSLNYIQGVMDGETPRIKINLKGVFDKGGGGRRLRRARCHSYAGS